MSRRGSRETPVALPIVWTRRALADLEAIGDFIARDKPLAAARWLERLTAAAERAAEGPMIGRRVPELGRDDLREVLARRYRLVYRVTRERLEVLTIFEGHRLFPRDLADE